MYSAHDRLVHQVGTEDHRLQKNLPVAGNMKRRVDFVYCVSLVPRGKNT